MRRGLLTTGLAFAALAFWTAMADAEVFAVPASVRAMRAPHEEWHVLRSYDGTKLGDQRSEVAITGDRLLLEVVTDFADGEHWNEHAEMNVAGGYRATSFRKVRVKNGATLEEQLIDFVGGRVEWLYEGERTTRRFDFQPDAYIGPMLGVILAAIPGQANGVGSFQTVVFRPQPALYTLRAEVVDGDAYQVGTTREPTTKLRLRADLGPVQIVLFASLIPTHYFWFTREIPPGFYAFEGELGYGGPDLRMIPDLAPRNTARRKTDS